MAMTSVAEVRFHARVRPGIEAVRARTAYPPRRRRWAPEPATVRLTRRGRLVAAILVMACTAAAVSVLWLGLARGADAASGAPAPRRPGQGVARVVVRPGQTLWVLAADAVPTADPRAVIGEIIQLNALHGTVIQPGQVLWVPRG